jgi:cytochrome P450
VQISPSEVAISDRKAFQEIHKIGGGFLKDPWYRKFRNADDSGSIDVFSSIDPAIHGAKRKVLARPFSKTSLRQNWEDMVIDKVARTITQIKGEIQFFGKADIFKWWTYMTTDMIGLVAFGEDFEMVDTGIVSAWCFLFTTT